VERRLRTTSSTGVDFARKRQLLVFDRFLARIVQVFGDRATLKGGLVVELRVQRARTTKDIDLRLVGAPTDLLEHLRRASRLDLADFMTFNVAPDAEHPQITNEGMAYEGQRYRISRDSSCPKIVCSGRCGPACPT
jgi:Nucleotidyl transferase AbiEii toxin, Type IV TA system